MIVVVLIQVNLFLNFKQITFMKALKLTDKQKDQLLKMCKHFYPKDFFYIFK